MRTFLLTALLACPAHASASGGPELTIAVEAPWAVAHQDDDQVAIRYGDSPHGVRIQLVATDDWQPGATPIVDGRPVQLGARPLIATPVAPRSVEVRSEGPDLVVRFAGPPLSALATRGDAPDDPVLTWTRFRPRGEDWRIVLDGLGAVSLPGVAAVQWTGDSLQIGATATLTTTATRTRSALVGGGWTLDTTPSVEAADPYPRTALTLSP